MVLCRGRAGPQTLLPLIRDIAQVAPFRFMTTRRGGRMAAAMTSAGACGWISDHRGYRYESTDPETGKPWPAMPDAFRALARDTAAEAGFPDFDPDTCLLNRYAPGAGMGLHRDGDERDFAAPIVSVSLGLPAVFLVGGLEKAERARPVPLQSGDVLVFGGPARLLFHGVRPVKPGADPVFGPFRYNLTFRRAR
ncbi:MAG TPA: DNA oxidative demethylase AlkB [Acidisoma sp.]|jgi:alkylated DNA repair protein (DNA oxidative demethylase)|uniref:DNA oxidative demethylase AlkB n=1 Tax=Acidisoma sp. TaxID=1872115 RepID=UPI002B688DE0|nr:DNA oxidative demethylase AlkB [Acidisoma sp.]HTI02833.1 DNA oxidative demethylase AlkB [Acidisoma sp.]